MSDTIRVGPETVTVTIDLPWSIAQQLVEHGPAIIKEIAAAINQREVSDRKAKERAKYYDEAAKTRRERWHKLGRLTDRKVRELEALGLPPARAISQIANNLEIGVTDLNAIYKAYRKDRNKKIRSRRDATIIRMYFLGYRSKEISNQLKPKISISTVEKVLATNRNLIQSLQNYRQTASIARASQSVIDPTEILSSPTEKAVGGSSGITPARQKQMDQQGVQLWRRLRRERPSGSERFGTIKNIAGDLEVHPSFAAFLISKRSRQVRQYLQKRRRIGAITLRSQGLTLKQIGERMKIHPRTVSKILDQVERDQA